MKILSVSRLLSLLWLFFLCQSIIYWVQENKYLFSPSFSLALIFGHNYSCHIYWFSQNKFLCLKCTLWKAPFVLRRIEYNIEYMRALYICACVCLCVRDWKAAKAKKQGEWKCRFLFMLRRPDSFKDVLFHGSLVEFMLMRASLQKAHQYRARTHSQAARSFSLEISPLVWRPTWRYTGIFCLQLTGKSHKWPWMQLRKCINQLKRHSCNFQFSLTKPF